MMERRFLPAQRQRQLCLWAVDQQAAVLHRAWRPALASALISIEQESPVRVAAEMRAPPLGPSHPALVWRERWLVAELPPREQNLLLPEYRRGDQANLLLHPDLSRAAPPSGPGDWMGVPHREAYEDIQAPAARPAGTQVRKPVRLDAGLPPNPE